MGQPPPFCLVPFVGVCEDDPALRFILTRALRVMDHVPVVVATAAEALRAFEVPASPRTGAGHWAPVADGGNCAWPFEPRGWTPICCS